MKRLYVIPILILFIVGLHFLNNCSSPLQTTDDNLRPNPPKPTDTVFVSDTVVITDTVFRTDTVTIEIPQECEDDDDDDDDHDYEDGRDHGDDDN